MGDRQTAGRSAINAVSLYRSSRNSPGQTVREFSG